MEIYLAEGTKTTWWPLGYYLQKRGRGLDDFQVSGWDDPRNFSINNQGNQQETQKQPLFFLWRLCGSCTSCRGGNRALPFALKVCRVWGVKRLWTEAESMSSVSGQAEVACMAMQGHGMCGHLTVPPSPAGHLHVPSGVLPHRREDQGVTTRTCLAHSLSDSGHCTALTSRGPWCA